MTRIIYDIGANNGDDISYYLLKGDLVVAVEANPLLCDEIRRRYPEAIQAKRLAVENVVATESGPAQEVDFYVHNTSHVLSQIAPPAAALSGNFTARRLRARPITEIIDQYGDPFYIKLDIEGYDARLLRVILTAGIRPPYISAECHDIEVFQVLLECGGYKAFKLVDGASVASTYANRVVRNDATNSLVTYSFPFHSAGPFGDDIEGPWMTPENFLRLLAFVGFGWKDIHAAREARVDVTASPCVGDHLDRLVTFKDLAAYTMRRGWRSIGMRLASMSRPVRRRLRRG